MHRWHPRIPCEERDLEVLSTGGNKTSSCVSLRSVRGTSEKYGQLQGENTGVQICGAQRTQPLIRH